MNRFVKFFFQGLLYTIPISVTIYVVWNIVASIDAQVQPWLPFNAHGLGVVIVFALITAIGVIGNLFVTLPIVLYVEKFFIKAPLVRIIYTSLKDLMSSFVGQKKSFNKPVLVKLYPESEIYRLGFLTDEALNKFELGENMVSVYVPHSYAISGQLFIVDKSMLKVVDVNATGMMKYIVSGGVTEMTEESEH
ncbi:MAG: DUF502 domain-containing protein [Chlamydiia bacterium]|nr:DUF502 domain-containing protein [Chlamydiia bacterium]